MLHPTEQSTIANLNDRLEDLKKIMKQYSKFTTDQHKEFEVHYQKISQITKQYTTQVQSSINDSQNLGNNIVEFVNFFDNMSKTTLSQLQEFMQLFYQSVEQYDEKMNIYTHIVTDGNYSQQQKLTQSRNNFKKAKEKYDKLCKEIESTLNYSKKTQGDALTAYDLNINQKNDFKLKDLVKQVEIAEKAYKDASDQLTIQLKEFNQHIQDSRTQLLDAHKFTRQIFVDTSMKLDQHKQSAHTWVKGQLDEKSQKILQLSKIESQEEDKILSLKYEGENQTRYIDYMDKILNQKTLSDQEYLIFPDILHRHIDAQLSIINERLKNQKIFPAFLLEISNQIDAITKGLLKHNKLASAFVQDKSEKDKINFIKPILQIEDQMIHNVEDFFKKYSQFCQQIIQKSSIIDTLIKDQKNQEKSFINMYQKMLKDFSTLKQQILENEQKPIIKEQLFGQLRKSVKENSIAIKYSIDQVRTNETQRSQQILSNVELLLTSFNTFLDESIILLKQSQGILNEKFNSITNNDNEFPLKYENMDMKYVKIFEVTEEIKKKVEDITLLQQQDEEECDDKNLEEGSVKVSQKLIEQFRIQDGDRCIASFACALDNKILLQGRMYIFTNQICFHSYFNGKTLFGTTALGVPASDILSIKRVKSYMVDAALEFKTIKGPIIFASLSNRERTLLNLKQVKGIENGIIEEKQEIDSEKNIAQVEPIQVIEKSQITSSQTKSPSPKSDEIQTPLKKQETEIKVQENQQDSTLKEEQQQTNMQQSQNSQLQLSTTNQKSEDKQLRNINKQQTEEQQEQNNLKQVINEKQQQQPEVQQFNDSSDLYTEIIVNGKANRHMNSQNIIKFNTTLKVSVKEFLDFFILDTPYENYISFPHYYQVVLCKDKDIEFQKYNPTPKIGNISKRQIKFIHPVREKQMFAPEVVHCTAEDTIYYFSDSNILIEKEVKFAKIPYADCFTCRVFWYLTENSEGQCVINYGFFIHFTKSCLFKSKIESGSKAENTEVWEKYLKNQYEQGQETIISKRQKNLQALIIPENIQIETSQKQTTQIIQQEEQKEIIESKVNQIPQEQIYTQSNQDQNIVIAKLDYLTQLAYIIIGLLLSNIFMNLLK